MPEGKSEEKHEHKHTFRVSVIGKPDIGKSCMISRYIDKSYREIYIPTSERSMKVKNISPVIRLQIWDHRVGRRFAFKDVVGSDGIILVYDTTCRASFKELFGLASDLRYKWIVNYNTAFVLVGTKRDLSAQREVSPEDAEKAADRLYRKELGSSDTIPCIEVSSKTAENIDEVFETITKGILTALEPSGRRRTDDPFSVFHLESKEFEEMMAIAEETVFRNYRNNRYTLCGAINRYSPERDKQLRLLEEILITSISSIELIDRVLTLKDIVQDHHRSNSYWCGITKSGLAGALDNMLNTMAAKNKFFEAVKVEKFEAIQAQKIAAVSQTSSLPLLG